MLNEHTIPGGTMTTEGFIPYEEIGGIKCPVALDMPAVMTMRQLLRPQQPSRTPSGRLVYVLPGGLKVTKPD